MLASLKVSNYRSIGDVELKFNKSNVIVGPNGAGKSNLIDSLNFVRDCVVEDLDSATTKRHGADSVRRWSKFKPYNVNIELSFKAPRQSGVYKVALSSSGGLFRVHEESGVWHSRDIRHQDQIRHASFSRTAEGKVTLSGTPLEDRPDSTPNISPYELFVTQAAGTLYNPLTMPFRGLAQELSGMSTYAIYPNTIRQPQVVSREDVLANDGSNLAATLKRLNSNQRRLKERLVEALRIVMPSLSDILVKSAGGYYVPVMRVKEQNGESHEFNMSQLSDGTLRMLGLLTSFYQVAAPKRISLEEPEQMIHPGLLPLIRDAAEDYAKMRTDNQYFITTHSPTFLDQFDPNDIIWMSFDSGISSAQKIDAGKLALIHEDLFSPGELLVSEGLGL